MKKAISFAIVVLVTVLFTTLVFGQGFQRGDRVMINQSADSFCEGVALYKGTIVDISLTQVTIQFSDTSPRIMLPLNSLRNMRDYVEVDIE